MVNYFSTKATIVNIIIEVIKFNTGLFIGFNYLVLTRVYYFFVHRYIIDGGQYYVPWGNKYLVEIIGLKDR